MAQTTIFNKFGQMAGWNNVTVHLLGRDLEGITDIDYSDSLETENAYGAGKYPIGRGSGKYSAKASITIFLEESIALQQAVPSGKNMSDISAFDILVEYEYDNYKYKDRIRNCQFTGRGMAIKQGDKTIAYKYELLTSHIEWNVN
jgi:hypothetical protein